MQWCVIVCRKLNWPSGGKVLICKAQTTLEEQDNTDIHISYVQHKGAGIKYISIVAASFEAVKIIVMGCCPSTERASGYNDQGKNGPGAPGSRITRAEDQGQLVRLFLVGCGEVGKSTLLKQMQNLCLSTKGYEMFDEEWDYAVPFNEEERGKYRLKVHQNVFQMMGTLIVQAEKMGLNHATPRYAKYAREIIHHINGEPETLYQRDIRLKPEVAKKMEALWTKDSAISGAWNRRREFLISDSTEYFLAPAKLRSIASPNYVPTVDDILRVRDPTTGIRNYNFRLHRIPFSIHDMGGQPVERPKLLVYLNTWLSNTKPGDKNFILYVAALSDYNQIHPNHKDKTWLDESVELLRVLLNVHEFRDCGFILFLNKQDIFQQKINTYKDFNNFFGEYLRNTSLSTLSLAEAERVVARKFADAVNSTARSEDQLYCRFTTAVDREMMQTIFAAVRNDIIHDLIKQGPFP